eukprot:scaffold39906_cov57-Attheya_sp.AAC.4
MRIATRKLWMLQPLTLVVFLDSCWKIYSSSCHDTTSIDDSNCWFPMELTGRVGPRMPTSCSNSGTHGQNDGVSIEIDGVYEDDAFIAYIVAQFFHETFGNAFQSLLVYSAYLKRRCEIAETANMALRLSASKYDGIASSIAILINKKDGLLKWFNDKCYKAISNTITTFQDFSKRLIPVKDIDMYIQIVKLRASALFEVFATLREEEFDQDPGAPDFFQILAMFNERCKVGTDWAAILSIAKCGWGLGKLAASVDSYFGVEISQSTYATRIGDWTDVLAFDNCQEGTQLSVTPTSGVLLGSGERVEGCVGRRIFYFLEKSGCVPACVDAVQRWRP